MTATGEIIVECDLMVPARDGVLLATDVYRPEGPGAFPILLERTPYDKSAPSRYKRTAAIVRPQSRGEVAALFRRARLCRRLSGLSRPLSFGRPFHEISERGRGRLRRARLAPAPALVQRPGRHPRAVLCGAHAGRARLSRPAGTGRTVPRLRRLLQRLSQRHPSWRRVRSEAGDMGLSQRPRRCPRPDSEGGVGGAGHRRLVPPMPWHKGDSPISVAPEYEDCLFEQWSHGVFDDYWKQPGIYAEGFYDRYADVPIVHLSGWYDPYARTAMENYVGLSRAKRSRAAGPRAVDPWRPLVEPCRRGGIWPRCSGRWQPCGGFL